ncbi:MAG: hypothetical protein ACE5EQ_08295 [Phycisphaerae bacterium]
MGKKIGMSVVLIALIGTSIYMWTTQEETVTDTAIGAQMEDYVCSSCGESFQLSVDEAGDMLRAGNGIVCPACGAGQGEKQNVTVNMGFFTPGEVETPEEVEEEAPPAPAGGMKKKGE